MMVFLLLTGLFMWVFPGDVNQLERGTADLDTLFYVAPWVFMFLIPAITMRSFSEEKRTGTLELLLTKPITDSHIIISKFMAGWFLVLISIIPSIVYFISIYLLGDPIGNLDTGGILGSYIGLLLLGMCFVSVGLFASTLTSNQVVAFILATFISFIFFAGIEMMANFNLMGTLDHLLLSSSLNEHYLSMSRGILDTRDIIYFLGFASIFLILTQFVLSSRKW